MAETTTLTRVVDGIEIPEPGTYAIDPSHTHVGFAVRHLMVSKVRGRFANLSGTVVIGKDPVDSSVEVSVDLASIDTRDEQRDGHLRSPDFFDVEAHPAMTFRSTSVRHAKGDTWIVDGDLALHGATQPFELELTFEGATKDPWGGTRVGFSAKGELNREDFGLTWNLALETGGVVLGKKITVEIEAEVVKQ